MQSEDETYSTIFNSLKHPVRRKILRMLSEKPRNFSEMLEVLGMSSSHLTYHLENLGELVNKTDDGKYKLSGAGDAAVLTMSKVEDSPKTTEPKHFQTPSIKWKYFSVAITIGLIILASVTYMYFQSSTQAATEYSPLADIMNRGALFESQYTLRCINNGNGLNLDEAWAVIYTPYDGCVVNLDLAIDLISSPFYVPIVVQKAENGNLPIVWRLNASLSGEYQVQLASRGYYTVSLAGPVETKHMYFNGNDTMVIEFPMPIATITENLDCSISLSLTHDGKYSPFGVTPSSSLAALTDLTAP